MPTPTNDFFFLFAFGRRHLLVTVLENVPRESPAPEQRVKDLSLCQG